MVVLESSSKLIITVSKQRFVSFLAIYSMDSIHARYAYNLCENECTASWTNIKTVSINLMKPKHLTAEL